MNGDRPIAGGGRHDNGIESKGQPMSPQILMPMRPRTLRRRLTLILFGGLLSAAVLAVGVDAGAQFVLGLAAMLILSGVLAFTVLLGAFRLYEWWAESGVRR